MNQNIPVIGVDLGTTNCYVGGVSNGQVVVLKVEDDDFALPCCVGFEVEHENSDHFTIALGSRAKFLNFSPVVSDAVQIIGCDFDHPEVQQIVERGNSKIVNCDGRPLYLLEDDDVTETYSPEQIVSFILGRLKAIAEEWYNQELQQAVIAVPANFNVEQRESVFVAACIAGMENVQVIPAYYAAAASLIQDAPISQEEEEETVLVVDIGEKVFQVAVVTVSDRHMKVLAYEVNSHLGTKTLDDLVIDHIVKDHIARIGISLDIGSEERLQTRIRTQVKRCRESLVKASITKLSSFWEHKDLAFPITRRQYQNKTETAYKMFEDVLEELVNRNQFAKENIKNVLLVGEASEVPLLKSILKKYFLEGVVTENCLAVVKGATLMNISRYSIEGLILEYPEISNFSSCSEVSSSLGYKSFNGRMAKVLDVQSKLPALACRDFCTWDQNQTEFRLSIYEGEDEIAENNVFIGEVCVRDIPPAPAGTSLRINFWMDVFQHLTISTDNDATLIFNRVDDTGLDYNDTSQDSEGCVTASISLPVDTSPVIGIDLGTTNSCVGIINNGKVHILKPDDESKAHLPSYVAFEDPDEGSDQFLLLYGDRAKNFPKTDRIAYCSKRLIGRSYKELENEKDKYFFKIVDSNKRPKYHFEHQGIKTSYFPEEISSYILERLKEMAETHFKESVRRAVITVPAYFNQNQRQATRTAARLAGLQVTSFLSEPCAAAVAYAMDINFREESQVVLVFDFGGGTLDVAILQVSKTGFMVVAIGGDSHLGGQDIDCLLAEHFRQTFNRNFNTNLMRTNTKAWRRLLKQSEILKISLSSSLSRNFRLEYLAEGKSLHSTLSRQTFEDLSIGLYTRAMNIVEDVVQCSGIGKENIQKIILVGGSSQIPKMQSLLRDYFGDGKVIADKGNMNHAVAIGATVMAALKNRSTDRPVPTVSAPEILLELLNCSDPSGLEKGRAMNVVVTDFRRKALDVTVLSILGKICSVLAVQSDMCLGGKDIDALLAEHFLEDFNKTNGTSFKKKNVREWERLLRKCEAAKIQVSCGSTQTTTSIDSFYGFAELNIDPTPETFHEMTAEFIENAMKFVDRVIGRSGLQKTEIDKVLLIGGNSSINSIRQAHQSRYGKNKIISAVSKDKQEVLRSVVSQAFLRTKTVEGEYPDVPLQEVLPLSLGYKSACGEAKRILHRNTPLPVQATKTFTTKENNRPVIVVPMYEGEDQIADNNFFLGELRLGIPSAPAGYIEVEVTFAVDTDGNLTACTESSCRLTFNRAVMTTKEIDRVLQAKQNNAVLIK